jgi:ribosomal-protein-alanine N-acetyltransferase
MAIPLSITPAAPGDAPAIAHLSRVTIEHDMPWRYTPARAGKMIRDRDFNVIVARDGPTLAGFGSMRYDDDTAHLYLLAVDPRYRRKRVGDALLSWLETSALTAGIGIITLECRATNQQALSFYQRAGYRELARLTGYYLGREDAIRLGRDLHAESQ